MFLVLIVLQNVPNSKMRRSKILLFHHRWNNIRILLQQIMGKYVFLIHERPKTQGDANSTLRPRALIPEENGHADQD